MDGELKQYIDSQRSKGVVDAEIERTLVATGWDSVAVKAALAPVPITDQPPKPPLPTQPNSAAITSSPATNHLNASQILLVLGVLLVVVAVVVILTNTWSSLSPVMRFLAIAAPNGLLFLISFFVKDENLAHIKDGTNATGILLLPASIGVFLYQFHFIEELSPLLIFTAIVAALPVSFYYDVFRKKHYAAVLSVLLGMAAVLFLGTHLKLDRATWLYIGFVIGTLLYILARTFLTKNEERCQLYKTTSAFILFFAVPGLISELMFADTYGSLSGFATPGKTLAYALVVGTVALIIGSIYSLMFKPNNHTDYSIQRLYQLQAMFALFVPLLMLVGENSGYLVIALILSSAVTMLGVFVGVNLLFISGIIGLVINLLFFLFEQININHIISLLLLGFIAIGLSIALGKMKVARKALYSSALASKLGFISDEMAQPLTATNENTKGRTTSRGFGCLIIILVLIGIPMILSLVFRFISPYGSPYGY